MKAVYVREFGSIDSMEIVDLPDPQPGPGQVLVRVRASGINFAETRMRAGSYGGQAPNFVLGMESAGEVEALGPGVSGLQVGQRVFGRARGSHAQEVLFDENHLMPLPSSLTFEQGAAIPVDWLTAWHALVTVAKASIGQRVLIEAIGSSVGSAALQIARWQGCWVAGTASTDEKVRTAISLGADAAYNYLTDDVAERVRADTASHGADVALMVIGELTAQSTLASMAQEGKVVMFGSTGGRRITFDLAIGDRNLSLLSMSIASSPRFLPETMRAFRGQALSLFESGAFRPLVDTVLPIEDVYLAHRMVDERKHFGKIVLRVA